MTGPVIGITDALNDALNDDEILTMGYRNTSRGWEKVSRPAQAAAQEDRTTWAEVELGLVLDGDDGDEPPAALARTDGQALLYAGRVNAVAGEPESGKSWLAHLASAERIREGEGVLYVDLEDQAASVIARQLALGTDPTDLLAHFHYVRPQERLQGRALQQFEALADRPGLGLAVIDGVTGGMVLHGLDPLSNPDVERFFEMLPRRLARRGLPVLLTDHVTKDREGRGRYAIGAQHKLAAIDGAAYSLAVVRPFGRGLAGAALLTVTKDRPGYVRQAAGPSGRIGELRVASLEDGRVMVGIEPPTASDTALSVGKRRTLSALQAAGPMVTASQLQERIADEGSIPLKLRTVQTALVDLERLGLATGTEAGPGEVRYWTATGEAP